MTIGDPHPFRPQTLSPYVQTGCLSCGAERDDEIHDTRDRHAFQPRIHTDHPNCAECDRVEDHVVHRMPMPRFPPTDDGERLRGTNHVFQPRYNGRYDKFCRCGLPKTHLNHVMPGEEPTMGLSYGEQNFRPEGYQPPSTHTAQQVAELEKRVASLERTRRAESIGSALGLAIRVARLVRARRTQR